MTKLFAVIPLSLAMVFSVAQDKSTAPLASTNPTVTSKETTGVQATPEELRDPRIARLKMMCERGLITTPELRKVSCDLYGFNYPEKTSEPEPITPAKQDVPTDIQALSAGFYYKTQQGWQKLEPLAMAGGGAKHMGKMFVPGLTPQMVWTFRDAESPAQITGRRPVFCVKEMPSLVSIAGRSRRDLVIVRFDKKKDHRELQVTNGGNMFTFKSGLSKDRMPDITAQVIADGVFMVTPNDDLKPGEYMISFSALGIQGYDFGIK